MGNDAFKGFNIREKYAALQGMPYIDKDDFTDEFERECFMSINVIR